MPTNNDPRTLEVAGRRFEITLLPDGKHRVIALPSIVCSAPSATDELSVADYEQLIALILDETAHQLTQLGTSPLAPLARLVERLAVEPALLEAERRDQLVSLARELGWDPEAEQARADARLDAERTADVDRSLSAIFGDLEIKNPLDG